MIVRDSYYPRNLPHYQLPGYPLFNTFRLAGFLPIEILAELKAQRESERKALQNKDSDERYETEKNFGYYDDWLDQCKFGPHWLKSDSIAQLVLKELHNLNRDRYQLIADCIMPNPVHLLIESLAGGPPDHQGKSAKYPITDSLRLLKGRTARVCNLELNRNGSFWQHKSYHHVVRDEQELEWTILYILNNPLKAGLVKEWKDWPFAYISPDLGEM